MIKAFADKAWLGITGGICLFLSALFVGQLVKVYVPRDVTGATETLAATIAILAPFFLMFLSAITLLRGCCLYAKANGYPMLLGFMLGMSPIIACVALGVFLYHQKNAHPRGLPVAPRAWRDVEPARQQ